MSNYGAPDPRKVVSSECHHCGGKRNHSVLATASEEHEETSGFFITTFDLLRCLGCESLSVRRDQCCTQPGIVFLDEETGEPFDDGTGRHEFDYWPAVKERALPEWFWEIEDPSLKQTLRETYEAFNRGSPILAAAGTRIVFDVLAHKLFGKDLGTFEQKLKALSAEGHIGEKQKETLSAIVEAGSAAQHRAHQVAHDDLALILAILETLIHQTTLAGHQAANLRLRTPPKKAKISPFAKSPT